MLQAIEKGIGVMGGKSKDKVGDGDGPLIEGSYFVAGEGYVADAADELPMPLGSEPAPREFQPYVNPPPRDTRRRGRVGRLPSNGKLFDIEA